MSELLLQDEPLCDEGRLSRYLAGDLSAEIQFLVEEHLNVCQSCRTRLEHLAAGEDLWKAAADAFRGSPNIPLEPHRNCVPLPLMGVELQATAVPVAEINRDAAAGDDTVIENLSCSKLLERLMDPPTLSHALGRIGKYEVVRVAGQGGMGIVLQAIDMELRRPVALKTLAHHAWTSAAAPMRIEREARAIAALRHPYIMPIFGLETWRDVPLIVMPLIEGGTLQRKASSRRLTVHEILSVGKQIASALHALHDAGIVHRDIKPSNILLQDELNHVLLSDFGLARCNGDLSITHSNALAGTPHFMSPEQAQGKAIDARSDLFSLGCVLYWLCTGKPPFPGNNHYEVIDTLVHGKAPVQELSKHGILKYLQTLIERLIAKRPEDRWGSAAEVESLLKSCLAHHQDSSIRLDARLFQDSRDRSKLVVHRGLWTVIVISVVGLGIASSQGWLRSGATESGHRSTSHEEPSQVLLQRLGPLDALDLRSLEDDLERKQNLTYWLRRLAYLPVDEVPSEILPSISALVMHTDPAIAELAKVILNKNPFQEVTPFAIPSADIPNIAPTNPFEEVTLDE